MTRYGQRTVRHGIAAMLFSIAVGAGAGAAEAQDLLPRDVLFGNPDRANPLLSPDGKRISFLAPVNGVLNLWVGPADRPGEAKPVTRDTGRGIQVYFWAFNNKHLLYQQDKGGDEDFHLYRVDPDSGEVKDLTPLEKIRAEVVKMSHRHPDRILVGINKRNPQLHDVFQVDLRSGERTQVLENPGYAFTMADDDLKLRLAGRLLPSLQLEILHSSGDGRFKPLLTVPTEDTLTTEPVEFDKSGRYLYAQDSRGRDKTALVRVDLETAQVDVIADGRNADIGGAMLHPTEKTVQAYAENYTRNEWHALDPAIKPHLEALKKAAEGDFTVASRTLDDRRWLVSYVRDAGPVSYYLYDRDRKKARFLFTNRKALEGKKLARMHPVVIRSRDGLELVSYLSLPVGAAKDGEVRPNKPLPMVLLVHGGPWGRDNWGYNSLHQWLANRGYAVLSVNFRASTGFGKAFVNAGNREWGAKMHDDLLDAVDWAIKERVADPRKVAIMGGSYGGYATLAGLAFTPERFACGVDIVGPSNLVTLMQNAPPYWMPMFPLLRSRVGEPATEEGRRFLLSRSPLTKAKEIRRPLLIGQGANDPRVKQAESDQIVQAMKEHSIPVTYVLYPDEGHGFVRPENRLSFFAVTEAFLAEHLGGRQEPIGEAFRGSSIRVLEGADQVKGLKTALEKQPGR